MTPNGRPTLQASIVIVNFNGKELLRTCLQAVLERSPGALEVIVVDNGSSDGSSEMVSREFPGVRLLASPVNLGFSAGNNLGTDAATADALVLLNNDTVVERGWLEPLLGALQDGAGAVTSRVETDGVPGSWYEMNGTINYLGYNIMRHFVDTSQVFFAGGASLAFRKSTVGKPFPDLYFLYHEDVYLSWRLRLMGHPVCMAQTSVVKHRGSASTKRHPSAFVTFYQERNRLLNMLIFYSGRTLFFLFPLLLADALAKICLALAGRGKSLRGILRAYAWPLLHRGWVMKERHARQRERRVPDAEILRLMSPKLLQEGTGAAGLVNTIALAYARITGLAGHG